MNEEFSEVEAQLKRLRPVAPRLDFEAIVSEARQSPTASLPARRTASSYRAIGLSWVGGALAGAALMYVGLGKPWATSPAMRTVVPPAHPASIAELIPAPKVERRIDPPIEKPKPVQVTQAPSSPPDTASFVFNLLSDPRSQYPVAALRAGAHLTGLSTESSEPASAIEARASPSETNPTRDRPFELPRTPEITRSELMRQLREDSPWSL